MKFLSATQTKNMLIMMALVPVSGVVTVSETDKTKPVYYQLLHQPPYNKTQDTNH